MITSNFFLLFLIALDPLGGDDDNEDELFASKPEEEGKADEPVKPVESVKPVEPVKPKKPAGAVSMFGGVDLFGPSKSPPSSAAAAKARVTKPKGY